MTKRGNVYHKTGGKCAYCGKNLEPFGDWHIDHAKPHKQGGGNDFENLWPACARCNGQKKGKTVSEFQDWIITSSIELLQRTMKRLDCAQSILKAGDIEVSKEIKEAIKSAIVTLEISQACLYMDDKE